VEEDSEGASEKQSNEGKAEVEKMEVKQEEKGSEGDVKSKNLGQEEEVKAAKRVISHEEAKVLAQQARDAINARISSVPEKIPSNSTEFQRAWKRVSRDREKLFEFLSIIPSSNFVQYFKTEVNEEIFLSILACIHDFFVQKNPSHGLAILASFIKVPRIEIVLKFLDAKSKSLLSETLISLEDVGLENSKTVHEYYTQRMGGK